MERLQKRLTKEITKNIYINLIENDCVECKLEVQKYFGRSTG